MAMAQLGRPEFTMNLSAMYSKALGEQSILTTPIALSTISDFNFITKSHSWQWHWYYAAYLLLAYQTASILWRFWWKAPSNVIIAAWPTPLGRWLTSLHMVFNSDTLLQRAYGSSNGKPFALPMTDRWIVFVSDRSQLKKLESVPEYVLSLEEALHEISLTEPILGHLKTPPENTKGPKSESLRVMVGVLRNKLRSNIPAMSPGFQARVREAVALEVGPLSGMYLEKKPRLFQLLAPTRRSLGSEKDEQDQGEWHKVRLMPALLRIFTRVNLLAFIGEEQADSLEAYDDVMGFFWSVAKAFPFLNFTPSFLLPLVGPIAMGWGVTRQKVYNLLLLLTGRVLEAKGSNEEKPHRGPGSVTQWVAEMTKLRDATAVARIQLGLLFASAFQVPMIAQACIYRFCKHPEFQETLRKEAVENANIPFGSLNQEMPYLDSFMKETARVSPGPILSVPRKVMVPYTSPDGYHVPTGNWLAIPHVALMADENIWPRASDFVPFRFVDEENGTSKTRLTHPSHEFPFWGSTQHACPARFYVSVVMKMILSRFMLDYEFKLADPNARLYFKLGKARLPSPFMTILVRKRKVYGETVSNESKSDQTVHRIETNPL